VHIVAGSLGIMSGFVALYSAKGGRLHRTGGMVFVYAMITMALMGALIAIVRHRVPEANAPMGLLTTYLVVTALTTVRPPSIGGRQLDVGLLLVVSLIAATLVAFGLVAVIGGRARVHGFPSVPFFIFGAIASLAALGDLRLIRAGGVATIRGVPRLRRHLWRMSTALLIAAFSLFLGQAKVFPKPIRIVPLLIIPPLLVLITLLYWLWRTRVRRASRAMVGVLIQTAKA
jgi:uncharacterized membrane protein